MWNVDSMNANLFEKSYKLFCMDKKIQMLLNNVLKLKIYFLRLKLKR